MTLLDGVLAEKYSWHIMAERSGKKGSSNRKRRGPPPRKKRQPPDNLIVPQEEVTYVVDPAQAGVRLDRFLAQKLKWRSRTKVQQLLVDREITSNGTRVGRAYKVKPGDTIRIPLPPPPEEAHRIADIPLEIIYEDEVLVVLNKQPKIIVHPVGPHRYNTLINALHLRYRNLEDETKDIIPKLAHRIDRETSGVLIALKTGRHDRGVPLVYEHEEITKEYLAIAEGVVQDDEGLIDLPIGPEDGENPSWAQRVVMENGRHARTAYAVRERFEGFTLLHLRIFTGRQHQIRVHLKAIGHPVLCDRRYGLRSEFRLSDVRPLEEKDEDILLLDRQALHSYRITFPHPTTRKEVTVEAPLPEDMNRTLEALRNQ